MFRFVVAAIAFVLAGPAWGGHQIADHASMFCIDDTGAYQPFERTDYARLEKAFGHRFGWQASKMADTLIFSADGQSTSPETIIYDVVDHDGGIALVKMHVRMTGVSEDLAGTKMCGRTFAIVNDS